MIGLFTPHNAVNYGTRLQAYAVQSIFSQYDDVEIIEYKPSIMEKGRRKLTRMILDLERYNDVKIEAEQMNDNPENIQTRMEAINRFNTRYKLSPVIRTKTALRKRALSYSAVVCGSDQVWNPRLIANHVNLLEFAPDDIKKISIAASFGVPTLPKNLKKYYRNNLLRFSSISVREENACKIVEDLGVSSPFWSLDPTLIVNRDIWNSLADEGIGVVPDRPFVFCYFLGTHILGRNIAKAVSKVHENSIIVSLPHFKQYVKADENFADLGLYDVGIPEFLALIRGARAVITDSFHGTAFSLIFGKDVYCTPRHISTDSGNTNNRITSLLSLLRIDDRMILSNEDISTAIHSNIDYGRSSEILKKKKKECLCYIENALH